MPAQPLLVLSEERAAQELRQALAAAQDHHRDRIHQRRVLAAGAIEFVAGWVLIGLGFHVRGGELGRTLFRAGVMVAYVGPVWTWLLTSWHSGEGP